ncbi:aromatic ring-opening dioxygenase LigA [Microbacterium betulae]|uniref:Aromatic ring-opening dioxygenase LigA n=1 Tax=Microbacterium betulae TaxID=2981139 RepID=A0AA97FG96_9MICO|nr:aromatic ring-opening dioxygenase LigA [Microbacterium sp. AB]WOF22643.1 aromatic ring-opening dioxygenase LigA [Microbacterium sp. AB]
MGIRIASNAPRTGGIRRVGGLGVAAGATLVAVGAAVWAVITRELRAEKITVAGDSDLLPGKPVAGPVSAYAQAEIIRKHALAASDGKTFAELPQDDPVRSTVMSASFLRASLFTSVVSYGVAAFAIGVGVVTGAFGWALRRTDR